MMTVDEEVSTIYGLEHQCRSLVSLKVDTNRVAFVIGTQSLKFDNQICLLEYDEESHHVTRQNWHHRAGEIWHLAPSYRDPKILATCYHVVQAGKVKPLCSIWRMQDEPTSQPSLSPDLKLECPVVSADEPDPAFQTILAFQWQPTDEPNSTAPHKALVLGHNAIRIYNCDGPAASLATETKIDTKANSKLLASAWSPHHNANYVALAHDSTVEGRDLRAINETAWTLDCAHWPAVRNLDFNPNLLYYLATCGDDCQVKIWDVRSPKNPLLSINNHSHWVWSVRYNPVHDMLLLSCSSDARLILHCANSVSSEISSAEDSALDIGDADGAILAEIQMKGENRQLLNDGVVKVYEEHEESVYCCDWSFSDAWVFASLSYDGRVIINRVPKKVKEAILELC